MFMEYPKVAEAEPDPADSCHPLLASATRIIFSKPYTISDRSLDYRQTWIDETIGLQNRLDNVREPVLSERHSLNNNPSEPYF